jgi:hypothetical protein
MHPQPTEGGSVGPNRQTGPTPTQCKKVTQSFYATYEQPAQATGAHRDVWLAGMAAQARELQAEASELERAAIERNPFAIEARAHDVSTCAGNIVAAVEAAIATGKPQSPTRELLAIAAAEYHKQRGDRATLNPDARTFAQVNADLDACERGQRDAMMRPGRVTQTRGDEASAKTVAQRAAIQRAFPRAYDLGEHAGRVGAQEYSSGFHTWPPNRRNAYLTGFYVGLSARTRSTSSENES